MRRSQRQTDGDEQMHIYMIRHAETAKNRAKVLQGRSNAPLNEAGEKQSCRVGAFFLEQGVHFDRIYSSPLIRCVQTAEIAAQARADQIVTDDRLLEMDYGPYEGTSLESPPLEIIHFFSDFVHNPAPEGMESLDHVKQRLKDFLDSIKADPFVNVLIATHAIALKGALESLTPDSGGAYWSRMIGNCAVFRSELKDGQFSIPEEIFSLGYEPGV